MPQMCLQPGLRIYFENYALQNEGKIIWLYEGEITPNGK